jgi:hypothetical protein
LSAKMAVSISESDTIFAFRSAMTRLDNIGFSLNRRAYAGPE